MGEIAFHRKNVQPSLTKVFDFQQFNPPKNGRTKLTALQDSIKNINKEDSIEKGLIVLLIFIVCIFLAGLLVWFAASQAITEGPAGQVLVHSRAGVPYNVDPEPLERIIFIVLAALAPGALVFYFWIRGRDRFGRSFRDIPPSKLAWTIPVFATAIFVIPFINSDFVELLLFPGSWAKDHRILIVLFAVLLSFIVVFRPQILKKEKGSVSAVVWWLVVVVGAALQVLSYRIGSIDSVNLSHGWSVHVDAAIYALNQVVHGSTLIADLTSQYGFFPEVISPLFKVFGISVLSITVFFAVLQLIGVVSVAVILHRHVTSPVLRVLVFLAMSVTMSLFFYLNGSVYDIYIQYFPIRFFFPVVALLLFSFYTSKPSKISFFVLSIVSGLSVFWNIDTGVPVVVSIGATFLVKPLVAKQSVLRGIGVSALFGFITLATTALCFIALRIKAGAPLDFNEALAAQKIFYMTGFGMIPMPLTPDPWQAVIVVYAAGAIAGLIGWQNKSEKNTYDMLFCSAILGLGLFTYYQGRSHVNLLILAVWPAILIGGILTDRILSAVRNQATKPISLVLTIPFLLFVSLGTVTFLLASKGMVEDAFRNLSTLRVIKDHVVSDEMQFMRNTYRGRSCLILSQRQAIYSVELGIASPLKGPGIVETLLQSDLDKLVARALTEPVECVYLGVKDGSITYIDVGDALLMARFPVISKNPLGTMMLLEPAPTAAP